MNSPEKNRETMNKNNAFKGFNKAVQDAIEKVGPLPNGKSVNGCKYKIRFGRKEIECSQESCRIGTDGQRYCEFHYNQDKSIQHHA